MKKIIKTIKSNNLYMILCIYIGILFLCSFSIFCDNKNQKKQVMSVELDYNSIAFNLKIHSNEYEVFLPISGEKNVILINDENNEWTVQLFDFNSIVKTDDLFQDNKTLNNILGEYGYNDITMMNINNQTVYYMLVERNNNQIILGYIPLDSYSYLGFSITNDSNRIDYKVLEYLLEIKNDINIEKSVAIRHDCFDFLNSIINN